MPSVSPRFLTPLAAALATGLSWLKVMDLIGKALMTGFGLLGSGVRKAGEMREAHAVLNDHGVPLASNQVHYSLLHRARQKAREWFAALDYGFAHYTVALLGCRDGDGNTFIVDEHAERLWLPQRHAAAIRTMLARHTFDGRKLELRDLKRFVAGADVFSRQSDGTTIAGQYAKCGIALRCANTDRVNGWAEVMQGLGEVAAPPTKNASLAPGSAERAAAARSSSLELDRGCRR